MSRSVPHLYSQKDTPGWKEGVCVCRWGCAYIGRMVTPTAKVASKGGLIVLCNQIYVTFPK